MLFTCYSELLFIWRRCSITCATRHLPIEGSNSGHVAPPSWGTCCQYEPFITRHSTSCRYKLCCMNNRYSQYGLLPPRIPTSCKYGLPRLGVWHTWLWLHGWWLVNTPFGTIVKVVPSFVNGTLATYLLGQGPLVDDPHVPIGSSALAPCFSTSIVQFESIWVLQGLKVNNLSRVWMVLIKPKWTSSKWYHQQYYTFLCTNIWFANFATCL